MLYHLFFLLHTKFTVFNVFRYITFRTVLAILSALLISFLITPRAIKKFQQWKVSNGTREDVPERHEAKKGTPTMGGSVILIATIIPTLFWADLRNGYIWFAMATLVMFGAIGFVDDFRKLKGQKNKGVSGRTKLLLQVVSALAVSLLIYFKGSFLTQLSIPFFKHATPDLGIFYVAVCVLIIVGASNGVNLTDGLDGLAIGPVITVSATFLLFAYLAGNIKFAEYLQIFYVRGAGELAILCGAMLGAGIGFLWYNAYPAELFMGDTGSLCPGRRPRRDCRDDQAGIPPGDRGRHIRDGEPLGDYPGALLQMQGEEGVPHGAHSPPFRAERMERGKDRGPFLDHFDNTGPCGPEHAEIEVESACVTT